MSPVRRTRKYCSSKCRQRALRHPEEIKLCPLILPQRDKNKIESPTERFYLTRWGTLSKMDIANIGTPQAEETI
jgi:hypothetical protein